MHDKLNETKKKEETTILQTHYNYIYKYFRIFFYNLTSLDFLFRDFDLERPLRDLDRDLEPERDRRDRERLDLDRDLELLFSRTI